MIRLSNSVFYPEGRILMERVLPTLFRAENSENLRVMVDAGKVVAMAGMVISDLRMDEVTVRAACIGSVCTAEAYRAKGLATALMDDAVSHAVSNGASLALISGGRGLYRRMGCIDAGLFSVTELARGGRQPDIEVEARPWNAQEIQDLWELHQKEEVRFVRTRADMATLLEARAMFCRPAQTWVVQSGGQKLAYLCASGPDDRTGPGVVLVREIAGSREAILAAAHSVLEQMGAERMQIETPASDREMETLAATLGLPRRITGMHGTLKIIDRAAFITAIEPRFHGSRPALPDATEDLAAVVFGSVERTVARAAALLPLPLPGYGLNYI